MAYQTYPDGYIKSNIVLSVGLLVSNNIKYIRKAMEGLQPLLKAIPSELVIVDTVGEEKSDGSLAVCREYTDKIYHFDWINDFAAARNEILKHCSGEWFMFQDDDEVFEDVSELVAFFQSKDRYKFNSGFYYTCDILNDEDTSKAIVGRLVRRKPDTHFIWKIHEGFNEINQPIKQFETSILHYGYKYEREEDRLRKYDRNVSILREEIAAHPGVPKLYGQMVQEHMAIDSKKDEGFALGMQYLEILAERGLIGVPMAQWIIATGARYYMMKGESAALLNYIVEVSDKYPLSDYCKLTMNANIIESAIYNGGIPAKKVREACHEYFRLYDYFTAHPQEKLLQMQLDFPKFSTEEFMYSMAQAAAQYENAAKHYDEALNMWKRVDFGKLEKPWEFKEYLLNTLQQLDDSSYLEEYYRTFMRPEVFEQGNEKYLPMDLYKKKVLVSED